MITKKKDAQELLVQYKALFAKIFDKECTIKFDMHEVEGFIVTDIVPRTLQGVKNKPEKVEYEGKMKTPMMFELVNNQAPLYFLFDKTLIAPLSNGVRLTVQLDKPLNDKSTIEVDIRIME